MNSFAHVRLALVTLAMMITSMDVVAASRGYHAIATDGDVIDVSSGLPAPNP